MASDPTAEIAEARASILARIAAAAREAGRNPSEVTLTAVSKQQPDERIAAMLATGQRVYGENRVQEAEARWAVQRAHHPGLELRLIGPLQTNKAREAVELFDVIESVDRLKLVHALAEASERVGKAPRLFVQVNTGEEAQKAGVAPMESDALIAEVRARFGDRLAGLMCIPPEAEPAGLHFALLAKIAERNGLSGLSMGMSGDFETAVRFGATHVRVGSALFGARG